MDELPISLISPVRLTAETPNGIFYPFRPSGEIMLAVVWEDQPHLLHLTGERAFACFPLRPSYSAKGAIITDIQFRVDLSSRYDAERETDPLGALVVQNGRASVIAYQMGDGFGDPIDVPLWLELGAWSPDEKIGFSRWSIAVRDDDKRVTLWSTSKE